MLQRCKKNADKKSAGLFLSAFLLLYHLLINVGQVIVSISLPLVTLKLGKLLETVVGVVAEVARRVGPKVEALIALAFCQRHNLRKQLLTTTLHRRDKDIAVKYRYVGQRDSYHAPFRRYALYVPLF